MQETINAIIKHTAESEGFRANVYKCPAGFDTIGYGRNIEANPLSEAELEMLESDGSVSKEVAQEWLRNELEKCYKQLCNFSWFEDLDTARKGALVDMVYNLGFKGFCGFKNTIRYIAAQEWLKVCENLEKSRWFKQVGNRSKKISRILQLGVI